MSEPSDWIEKRLANALLPQARMGPGTGMLLGMTGRAALGAVGSAMGGLWVGGTAYLTADTFEFHPNGLNRLVHAAGSVTPVIWPLTTIDEVGYRPAMVTHIIDLSAGETVLSVRGYRMRDFHAAIVAATGRAGGTET